MTDPELPSQNAATPSSLLPRRRTRLAWALDADGIAMLADIGGAVGLPSFYPALTTLLRSLVDAELGVALHYSLDAPPHYVSVQGEAARRRGARESAYTNGPYILDPVYQMFQRGQADGAYAMASYVPDDFYESEFYQCFFRNTHLADTIDVLWKIDARNSIAFCLGREEGTPPFGAPELVLIQHLLPWLFATMRRHHQIAEPPPRDEDDQLVHRKVQCTMAHFGASLLTPREREVVFYMLSGYSSELTAQRLHTAEGTIRIHRKNIHRKLETGSQAELFSLFIQCIPFADPDQPGDPLALYQRSPARPGSGQPPASALPAPPTPPAPPAA